MQGTILTFYPERRYGFLQDIKTGADYFFHRGDVKEEIVPVNGALVSFDLGQHAGRTKAVNVRRLTPQQLLGGEQ
jgi:cold shock CspA family protein